MFNKSKINISVILIAIGIGLIPTGFITNGFIRDQVRETTPGTLLHIQDEAISEIEAQYLGLGVTELLSAIMNQETGNIKDEIVEVLFTPSTLLYLKNLTMPLFVDRRLGSMTSTIIRDNLLVVTNDILDNINGPLSALIINETLEQVITLNLTTSAVARDVFFNNYTFQVSYNTSNNGTAIKGVSEYVTSSSNSLNYTAAAQQSLLYGNLTYPGLIEDIVNGTGMLEFMELYENATNDPATYNISMQNAYNSTWDQLSSLATYVSSYLWSSIIPQTWNNTNSPSVYATLESRELFFNDDNWSSTTNGITPILGISEYIASGNQSYSALAQQRILYGYEDVPGILTNVFLGLGVQDYLDYYTETSANATMQAQYNCTLSQLNSLTAYIILYTWTVSIPAQLALEGLTVGEAILNDFYTQWANGSFFTNGIEINELNIELGDLSKAKGAANRIADQIDSVITAHNETFARESFFNDFGFQVNFSTNIKGVSEYDSSSTYSLNFTETTQNRLLDGYKDAPGIFTSLDSGFGFLNWLDFYDSAYLNIGTNRSLMETTYNATWATQLLPLGQYLQDYLLGTIIVAISQVGLEAGIPTATDIELNTTESLWDPLNSDGIVNDTGILNWYKAAKGNQSIQDQLNATFNLSQTQFNLIYSWIVVSAKNDLTPIVFIVQQPLGFRLTTGDYAEILFLEQWANGTVMPSGIDLGDGLKGFELGLPTESKISYNSASALFDTDNSSSFIDNYGILEWIDAYNGDVTVKNNLIALFNLDSTQMDMTLNWLFTIFKENIVPLVLTPLTGYTMTRLAGLEFHRQWTNGTLFVNGLDLDPAFGLISITDWELGIPMQSNINHETSQRLWDEEESYSLLSYKGNGLWFMASIDIDAFNAIKDDFNRPSKNFKLDDTQIKAIIAWFAKIKEDYSLPHLKEKLNLPLDVYTYANTVGLGFIIGGAIFLALGCVSIVYIFLSKRR